MPKSLTNRLTDLENEIHVLLTLQEPSSGCCNIIRGASVTTHSDGNVDKAYFEGPACQIQETGEVTLPLPKCAKAKSRPLSSPESGGRKRSNTKTDEPGDGQHQERRRSSSAKGTSNSEPNCCGCGPPNKPPPCLCGARREAALKKCICGPKGGNIDGKGKSASGSPEDLQAAQGQSAPGSPEALKAAQGKSAPGSPQDLKAADECKEIIEQLKSDMARMEATVQEAEEAKKAATEMTKDVQSKLEKMKTSSKAEAEEIAKLKKEKEELNTKLDKEIQIRVKQEEEAKQNVEKERKSLTEKVEKVELHAAKSAKKVKSHSNKLASAVKQRDDHIRKMSGTSERLADTIREKEYENRRLQEAHQEMIQNFIESQCANKKLADTNSVLVKSVKEFQEKLITEKATVQKLQRQIGDCKEESQKTMEDMDRMKERLKQCMQGPKDVRDMLRMQAKLKEARDREKKYLDEQAMIDSKLKELEESRDNASKQSDDELERMVADYKKLQGKYEDLMKKLQFTIEENQAKVATMEKEFQEFSFEMNEKQDNLTRERDELQADFDRLTDASKADRKALEELIVRTEQQDAVLKQQHEAILARDEHIAMQSDQISAYIEQVSLLNIETNTQRQTIEKAELHAKQTKIEMQDLKTQLLEEREVLLKREQTIAEQITKMEEMHVTINEHENKLHSVVEELRLAHIEVKRVSEEMTATTMELEQAKEDSAQLNLNMDAEKENIKIKVEKLGETADDFCKCAPAGESKQKKLITTLEQRATLLEKESSLQIQLVMKQKDQALNAARFATKKLLETVADFQEQVETQQKIQFMLTKMLREKEEQLKKMCPQRCSKPKSVQSVVCNNPKCSTNKQRWDTA